MRKNHHGKKDRLVKRVFALCLALAVICTCLVPVFATEGGWIATQELDASTQVATMDTAFGVDDGYGIDTQETDAAASTSQSGAVVDSGSTSDSTSSGSTSASTSASTSTSESTASSTTGTSEVITDPSTITDVKIPDGATNIVKNANGSYSYTTEYGRITVFPTKEGEKTTWTDDEVTITPNPNLKEDDAAFGVLPIEYHFWLKQLDSDTFRELDWEAEMAEMSETEYLALFGASEKFPIWHMDTIASTDTISNYKFVNPTAKDDPAGEGREFAYWYTVDENGVESEFNPYKTYGSETATVVNVYAKWKDASGDVVNEDTTKEETTTSGETKANPVEVSAKANIPDYDGEVTVTVTGLPSNVTHLSVTSMGDNSMQSFYELYSSKNKNSTMMPLLGYKISPKNAKGETVQPAKGQKATVTVSGLDKLPEMEGATADTLKVLHETSDGNVEILDVLTYTNGTLTFETSSFSPFVLALEYPDQGSEGFDDDGIEIVSIEIDGVEYPNVNDGIATISSIQGDVKVPVGSTIKLRGNNGKSNYYHYWEVVSGNATFIYNNKDCTTVNGRGDEYKLVSLRLNGEGKVQIRHTYGKSSKPAENGNHDTLDITVVKASEYNKYNLYVYTQIPGYSDTSYEDAKQHNSVWNGMAIGTIAIDQPASKKNGIIYGSSDIAAKLGTEIVVDSAQFPVIPIKQEDGTYKDYYYQTDPRRPKDAPYYTIEWYRVVVSDGANTGKNGADGTWDTEDQKNKYTKGDYASPIKAVYGKQYHLDGVLQFHDEVHINVSYKVQDAGITGFDLQADYSAVYKTEKDKAISLKNARRPDKDSLNGSAWVSTPLYPETKKVGRITYQFDGWYTNEACTGNKFDFENGTITKDTIFYAKYVPISEETDVTITKQVTGLLGDTNKEFAFSATVTNGGDDITSQIDAVDENSSKVVLSSFKLKHNQKITLKDVPVGATVTVTENAPGVHYKVTATGYTDEQDGGNNVSFTYITVKSADAVETASETGTETAMAVMTAVEADDIVVTNHAILKPDTGVLLDTLPYIVILAVVAGGVALLMLRKRRKEDD